MFGERHLAWQPISTLALLLLFMKVKHPEHSIGVFIYEVGTSSLHIWIVLDCSRQAIK